MKRVLFTMVLAIANLVVFAHGNLFSTVHIRTSGNRTLMVSVDGQPPISFNYQSDDIRVQPGNRRIQIIEVMPRTGYNGNGHGYGHYHHPNRPAPTQRIVYNGYLTVPANAALFTTFSYRYGLVVDNTVFANSCAPVPMPAANNGGCGGQQPHPGHNEDHYYGENNNYYSHENSYPTYYGPTAMYGSDFVNLKTTIGAQSFESSKMEILKQAVAGNYFTTSQVIELAQLFTFESYKLEAAKMLYNKTIDRQNYYSVNNVFTFSSSVSELNRYISRI